MLSPLLWTVYHSAPPPRKLGVVSAALSAQGKGVPQPRPWGSHRSENQVCLPEDLIVQITQSPLIITAYPTSAERGTEGRGAHGPCRLAPPLQPPTFRGWMDGLPAPQDTTDNSLGDAQLPSEPSVSPRKLPA